jgi:hypothetical protein
MIAPRFLRFVQLFLATLVLSTACQLSKAQPHQHILTPKAGSDSIRALLKYLLPALPSTHKSARVYYEAACRVDDRTYPLTFPKVYINKPSTAAAGIDAVRGIFAKQQQVEVTQDETGVIRIVLGKPPMSVLTTTIKSLAFTPDAQYNVLSAIRTVESAPEVLSVMSRLAIHNPMRIAEYPVLQPDTTLPHLPKEVSDVTMDQALDVIATTWSGVVFYGACSDLGMYEIFLTKSDYFLGARF